MAKKKSEVPVFSEPATRKIVAAVRRLLGEPRNDPRTDRQFPGYNSRGHMFGVTATCPEFPNYPQENDLPNTYVVKLQEWHFIEVPGDRTIEKISWSQYVVACVWNSHKKLRYTEFGPLGETEPPYMPEGTPVKVWPVWTRRGVRWWIEGDVGEDTSSGSSSESSSESSSGESSSASSGSSDSSDSSGSSPSSESSVSSDSSDTSDMPSSEESSYQSDASSDAPSDSSDASAVSSDEGGESSEAVSEASEASSEESYTCIGDCTVTWNGISWQQGGTYTCEPSDGQGICGCEPPGYDGDYVGHTVFGTCAKQ